MWRVPAARERDAPVTSGISSVRRRQHTFIATDAPIGLRCPCAARARTLGPFSVRSFWSRNDCEDRVRSLMVLGCGLVTAGVTHGMTGFCALVRLVRSWLPAPARLEELA
jgi:hypothetical protein